MFQVIVSILFAPVLLAVLVGSIAFASDAPTSAPTAVPSIDESENTTSPADTETTAASNPRVLPASADRVERAETRETLRGEGNEILSLRAQERVTNLAANLSNRLEAVITRLDTIGNRLESRLNKLSAQGVDVSESALALENARTSLDLARRELQGIDALVVGVVTSASPRSAWSSVRAVYINTKDAVRRAHASLRESVVLIKAALSEERTVEDSETDTVEPVSNS